MIGACTHLAVVGQFIDVYEAGRFAVFGNSRAAAAYCAEQRDEEAPHHRGAIIQEPRVRIDNDDAALFDLIKEAEFGFWMRDQSLEQRVAFDALQTGQERGVCRPHTGSFQLSGKQVAVVRIGEGGDLLGKVLRAVGVQQPPHIGEGSAGDGEHHTQTRGEQAINAAGELGPHLA